MAKLHQEIPMLYRLNLFVFNGHRFRNGGVTTATQNGEEDSNIELIEKCSMLPRRLSPVMAIFFSL